MECTSDSQPGCTKPTVVPTAAIAIAVIVPVVIAACVFLWLHQRHKRKLREEDAKDKYKSLDFGMGLPGGPRGKQGGKRPPEMALTEKSLHRGKGMSMDLDVSSPYILPAGLHGSRESFHSLSRSMHDPNDPYRPVNFLKDDASVHSPTRAYRHDNGSMYTTSSAGTDKDRMNNSLLQNASRMSQSFPPRGESMSPSEKRYPEIKFPEPTVSPRSPLHPDGPHPPPPPAPPAAVVERKPVEQPSEYTAFRPTPVAEPVAPVMNEGLPPVQESTAPSKTSPSPPPFPRIQSQEAVVQTNPNTMSYLSTSSYGDGFQITPPSPPHGHLRRLSEEGPLAPAPLRPQNEGTHNAGLGIENPHANANRLSMSLRPLPPDDPNDNPEQRANRIRSFYKEYFDDSKPEPVGGHVYNDYYEDYGSEFQDGAVFDPHSGAFVVAQPQMPFSQPVTRRAMTPPPRAPPRFRSGSNPAPRGPHMSNSSMASSKHYPPRGMSSMSGRLPQPRRPMPPPSALNSLPTPAKLTEDSMLFNAADFAPPVSIRDLQNGMRPDSPLGAPRPYSPAVRPHTPLVSSFDDLAALPSPHMLRKSGTFMALDFAPPARIRDPAGSNMSDAGSIRSNRSGISSAGRMAVRNGAYRVSRIPKEVVGTKDDIMESLRPQMNLVSKG
ncbi:hypothetical protein BU24DRAFT_464500 [Aaosphaeria arxii CBS 175.79]|uniref:Uncharacterized protein n=1 Tax=Aaosphaeria arxii CBS 175.79 TaxID=1450172 RepID=A0A6A5XLQ0_9PLEO|nr:uncharacterized protein BU24DRAFT_464500 [Aaosphaeria arxii CBS 175.79]KAF2013751.1 hypothetical protein BU24DRAFT_464500 [Aaosphaeria arxii CBS 175.79]